MSLLTMGAPVTDSAACFYYTIPDVGNGIWHLEPRDCSQVAWFVCQFDCNDLVKNENNCGDEKTHYIPFMGNYFTRQALAKTWPSAQGECESKGGLLPSMKNPADDNRASMIKSKYRVSHEHPV